MGGNLLSAKTAQDLELIKLINTVSSIPAVAKDNLHHMPNHDLMTDQSALPSSDITQPPIRCETKSAATSSDPQVQEILNKYNTVFEGQGKLNNQQVRLHIRDDVKPIIQPQCRIPYHMRKRCHRNFRN